MRTLVVGDIHAKPEVLGEIDAAAEAVGAERVVCLGDYLDPVWPPFEDERVNLERFMQVIAWAERRGDVTLLLGNHEAGYIDMSREADRHPEHRDEILSGPFANAPAVRTEVEGRRGLFAWATAAEGWLLSHAGLTCANAHTMDLAPDLDAVTLAPMLDAVGWADWVEEPLCSHGGAEELIADPYPVDQAVGHTAVETVRLFRAGVAPEHAVAEANESVCETVSGTGPARRVRLCFCDTMSMCDGEGRRTGDSSFLLLDDGEPRVVRGKRASAPAFLDTWAEPEWPGL